MEFIDIAFLIVFSSYIFFFILNIKSERLSRKMRLEERKFRKEIDDLIFESIKEINKAIGEQDKIMVLLGKRIDAKPFHPQQSKISELEKAIETQDIIIFNVKKEIQEQTERMDATVKLYQNIIYEFSHRSENE